MELQEMSLRNYQEFEYEKYDWKQVILETQMYVDAITGTLIHPCHLTEPPAWNGTSENQKKGWFTYRQRRTTIDTIYPSYCCIPNLSSSFPV